MKKRLLILSDLWGDSKGDWVDLYFNSLKTDFDITYYNCCDLGDIDVTNYKKEDLHKQFINHGINTAVEKLIALEPNEIDILAFSIGGTIAWKAALIGLNVNCMYTVSATRLRYELDKPNCEIKLIYGEQDLFKPSAKWFKEMNIGYTTIHDHGHELYEINKIALDLCNQIKNYCL